MPTVSRLFVKTGMIYLLLALAAGVALRLQENGHLPPEIQAWRPVFYHLLFIGWVTQLIFGVAWWMFPPISSAAKRGSEKGMTWVYALLNLGLILRAVAEPLSALGMAGPWSPSLLLAAAFQVGAAWLFVWLLWPRVRASASKGGT